jgi:hypothetical protein
LETNKEKAPPVPKGDFRAACNETTENPCENRFPKFGGELQSAVQLLQGPAGIASFTGKLYPPGNEDTRRSAGVVDCVAARFA